MSSSIKDFWDNPVLPYISAHLNYNLLWLINYAFKYYIDLYVSKYSDEYSNLQYEFKNFGVVK